jgi:hypothetical protein
MRYKDSIELRYINLDRGKTLFEAAHRESGVK